MEFMKELLMHRGDCSFCTKLIRRDLFPQEAFPVGKLNEDFHPYQQMEVLIQFPYRETE